MLVFTCVASGIVLLRAAGRLKPARERMELPFGEGSLSDTLRRLPDRSTAIYLVFMLIGLVGYFCVPTVANWVVQAGGMGAYNRNMNNTAGKAANVGGAVAGASTGNVAGVLLKK